MTSSVAIYTRVSTDLQARKESSIPEQIERCRKYCEAMRWPVFKVYTDAGFSGANTDRPALQELILDVKAGKVDKVLVYKLDRLSRSQKDTLELIEDVFLAYDADFVSMSENFDTSTPFGRAMIGILSVFAQLEREQIKERMIMGKEARAKKGLFHGSSNTPIGYKYIDGQLVPDPYESMLVRKIFELAAEGKSPYSIAKQMNEEGLTRSSGKWYHPTIYHFLQNRSSLGMIQHNGQWYPGQHPALISQELFDRVQDNLGQRSRDAKEKHKNTGRASSYLAGLIFCSRCGQKYYKVTYKHNNKKYSYYRCFSISLRSMDKSHPQCSSRPVKMETIDSLVFDEIRKLRFDHAALSGSAPAAADAPDPTEGITAEIERIDRQILRMMDLYADEQIPVEALHEKVSALKDKKEKLQEALSAAIKEKDDRPSAEDVLTLSGQLSELLDAGSDDEISAIVHTLIRRIDLDGEDVRITWNF